MRKVERLIDVLVRTEMEVLVVKFVKFVEEVAKVVLLDFIVERKC